LATQLSSSHSSGTQFKQLLKLERLSKKIPHVLTMIKIQIESFTINHQNLKINAEYFLFLAMSEKIFTKTAQNWT